MKGTYLNLITFFTEDFEQIVDIHIPPTAALKFGQTGPKFPDKYCEDTPIDLDGGPRPASGISEGKFSINGSTTYPGLKDNATGIGVLNAQSVGLANRFDRLTVKYSFKVLSTGCQHEVSSDVNFTPKPVADFTVQGIPCEDKNIGFVDNHTINGTSLGYQVDTWEWDFGDINASASDNRSGLPSPSHQYREPNSYNVKLRVTSNYGCVSAPHPQKNIVVGATPVVNFDFAGVSTADKITFRSTSTVAAPNAGEFTWLDWHFGDGSRSHSLDKDTIQRHAYASAGIYPVKLKVKSKIGCVDSLLRNIVVVPHVPVSDVSGHVQNFESGNDGWQTLSLGSTASSWERATPVKSKIKKTANTGATVWVTNKSTSYHPSEKSALYTSSFDLSLLSRPMISFNSMVQLEQSDGVVLQYSTDSLNIGSTDKKWKTLGSFDAGKSSGVDWYNAQNLSSKPGQQLTGDYGWADTTSWLESKHTLDVIKGAKRVVFRFALSSIAPNPARDGFALDNFRVGNRTRIVLLENFTNSSNTATDNRGVIEKIECDSVKNFYANGTSQIVKINYHTSFPGDDPLNKDNLQDPGARALYYNISATPLARMDGERPEGAEKLFSTWGRNYYNIRSLKLAQATIGISARTLADGSIEISTDVKNTQDNIALPANTILHVAVVENSITKSSLSSDRQSMVRTGQTEFNYVLKKLVPSASGTRFGTPLPGNGSKTFGPFIWTPDASKLYPQANDLSIVVFLQNEDTKEIYQTEIATVSDPPLVTGLDIETHAAFSVYPNPADKEFTIELPQPVQERTTLELFDQLGKKVHASSLDKGEDRKTLGTSDFAAGVYLIQINDKKGVLRRKVIVVHQN